MDQEYYLAKILLIGNSAVGKTSIMRRYCDNEFSTEFVNTIGVDFRIKQLVVNDVEIKLQIWDTAGQERFKSISKAYYRGAKAILIVYDITDRHSFEKVDQWIHEQQQVVQGSIIQEQVEDQQIVKFIIGSKLDLDGQRKVTYDEAYNFAASVGFTYFEVSSKENLNIQGLFHELCEQLLFKRNVKKTNGEQAEIQVAIENKCRPQLYCC